MISDDLETGMILHYIVDNGADIACAVTESETLFDDDDQEEVRVCFLDGGAGYLRGEVCYVSLTSFREFGAG